MFKYFILVILLSGYILQGVSIYCSPRYLFEGGNEVVEKSKECSNGIEYCVCITGTYKNQEFSIKDCQDTASVIVASYTQQNRDVSLSCKESANSRYSSGDYYYDYGCTDNNETCSLNVLHQNNKNLNKGSTRSVFRVLTSK